MQMIARNTSHSVTPVSFAAFGRKLPNARRRNCLRPFQMCLTNIIGYSGTRVKTGQEMRMFLGRTLGPHVRTKRTTFGS